MRRSRAPTSSSSTTVPPRSPKAATSSRRSQSGAIDEGRIAADLADLARGTHPGRTRADEITVFKSVGFALEDLAAAEAVLDADGGEVTSVSGPPPGANHALAEGLRAAPGAP